MPMQSCLPDCEGEEESFEDYAPKIVRIPGAHYEQMSLF